MRRWASLVAVAASLFLFGCSGMGPQAAKAPEKDPWADYKGTFASGVPSAAELRQAEAKEKAASASATATTSSDAKAEKADAKPKSASAKPSKSAESKPVKAELAPEGNDARAVYGDTPTEDAIAEAAAPKKVSKKKRGASPAVVPAISKPPAKKKPGKRAKR